MDTIPLPKNNTPAKDNTPEKRPRVQSVARAASILFVIANAKDGLSALEVREETGLPRQATYHLLHTLQQIGLLRRSHDNKYVLGLRVGDLIDGFNRQFYCPGELRQLARTISDESGETSGISGWFDDDLVTLVVEPGINPIQASGISTRIGGDVHARASGKLLLALAGEAAQEAFLTKATLSPRTKKTLITPDALRSEFKQIASDGYAVDGEEYADGLSCVALPLELAGERYAVCVSAPSARFKTNFQTFLTLLRRETDKLKISQIA